METIKFEIQCLLELPQEFFGQDEADRLLELQKQLIEMGGQNEAK